MRDVIVVGAGLSGLIAARAIHREGRSVVVFDAQDRIGGRIQTDELDGFLLDHGFQVYLTGYATAKTELDLERLQLGTFTAGAYVQYNGKRHLVSDPLRAPWRSILPQAMQTLVAPVGSVFDKLRIATFRNRVCKRSPSQLVESDEGSSRASLQNMGFSETMIERFFRPFFGGIFLEESLETKAAIMDFVFQTFGNGYAALPRLGMHAIPRQIADCLPTNSIRTSCAVSKVERGRVLLADGTTEYANSIIVATEEPAADRLLKLFQKEHTSRTSDDSARSMRDEPKDTPASTSCLYFSLDESPIRHATLVLNGEKSEGGVINNLCFPNLAQSSYAPPGKSLLSVSTIDHCQLDCDELLAKVKSELISWFGAVASDWKHLRTYRVPYALPNQTEAATARRRQRIGDRCNVAEGIYRCGDYCETASIEGAIQSGLRTAAKVLGDPFNATGRN